MTDEHYAGLTQLGHHVEQPASPEAAMLERVANPARGRHYVVRFTCPGIHLALPADRPAGLRPYRHRLRPARLDRREQVAEAVPRRRSATMAHSTRPARMGIAQAADRRCSTRCGCASAATGIRAAACRSTCSSRPARRPRAPGSRRRTWRRIVGGAELSSPRADPKALIRDEALALGFDAIGFCRAELGGRSARPAGRFPRRRTARRHGLARTRPKQRSDIRATCGPRRAASSCSACPTRRRTIRSPRWRCADRGTISVYARNRDYHDVVKGS